MEQYFKYSTIEILFFMKYVKLFIAEDLKSHYKNQAPNIPYSTVALSSLNITVYDNISKTYLDSEQLMHSSGFDGLNIVDFDVETKQFETSARYIFCCPATEIMIDHLIYERMFKLGFSKNQIRLPKNVIIVQGVPGCGKSTWIINNHSIGNDLVLSATKHGIEDIKSKVEAKCVVSKNDFTKIKSNYRTIASFLINGNRQYQNVFVDEFAMVHAGLLGLVAWLTQCNTITLMGDANQIPYIDRLRFTNMRFFDAKTFTTQCTELNITYRCPLDITFALSNVYPQIKSTSKVLRSAKYIKLTEGATIPASADTLYLTFTKNEKRTLESQLVIPSSSSILTIHEAQGLTKQNVICVRLVKNSIELYDSRPHAIVAMTRHTQSLTYYSKIENDLLHKMIKRSATASIEDLSKVSQSTTVGVTQHSPENHQPTESSQTAISSPEFGMSLYYHNSSGIRTKSKEILLSVLAEDYDIICIAETWLVKSFKSSEYFPDNYIVYRRDRYDDDCTRKGGGVLIGVKSSFRSNLLFEMVDGFEIIVVKVDILKKVFILCLVYIPSGSNDETYTNLISTINSEIVSKLKNDEEILILGDFNLPDVGWIQDDNDLVHVSNNVYSNTFLDSMAEMGVKQSNQISNSQGKFFQQIKF